MSYMNRTEKISGAHYRLPKLGDMGTRVDAFLSENLFAQTDETLWRQAVNAASYPGAESVYLMPDTHVGYHVPVGGVLVTDGVVVQAGSGFDISCGVLYARLDGVTAKDIVDKRVRRRWIDAVESRVATGLGSHRPDKAGKIGHSIVRELVRYGAQPLGVNPDLCERPFIPVPDDFDETKIERAWNKATPQMGSLGGGNHFIEMQVDEKDGSVWVMIHCGSRGFGWQIANYYFYEGGRLRGLPPKRREESWLRLDEPLGREYWAAHNAAANYAIANRWCILGEIEKAVDEVFNAGVKPYYEISHNLVQEETIVSPDGSTKRRFVHRKGATRALPALHPDLGNSKWRETGHPVLIPGSMHAGAAILFPQERAHEAGCSVNHGSGRLLGRGQAKRELHDLQGDIDHEMNTTKRVLGGVEVEGIVTNSRQTPLDECAYVYKDLDEVLGVLESEGIAKVTQRLYPVANLKGMD